MSDSETSAEDSSPLPKAETTVTQPDLPMAAASAALPDQAAPSDKAAAAGPTPPATSPPSRSGRRWLLFAGIVTGVAAGGYVLIPFVRTALNTVSTDDAYVNGHVTFVAPRVAGHVIAVLVDNNQRVRKRETYWRSSTRNLFRFK